MMRPSVPAPTGTETALPVLTATRLRFRPSVEPSAIVRTTPSPSCCCTSRVIAVPCTFSASYTRGTLSRGNSTSTTAPMIWTILPWLLITLSSETRNAFCRSDRSRMLWRRSRLASLLQDSWSDRGRAADDLGNFLGDRRLARLVVDQVQRADQLGGVVRRRLHRHHARGVLGRDVLEHRLVHQRLDVAGQHVLQHGRRVRL